jgi:homoserine dehydrogenase
VHPVFIPADSFLAKVDGVYNAVLVEADLAHKVLFFGEGAGPEPTSSAVVADIVSAARKISLGVGSKSHQKFDSGKTVKLMADIETQYYVRLSAADRPGVLAQIARVLGDKNISIASAIQPECDEATQTAEIVIMTHPAREQAMQQALGELRRLEVVKEISNFIRVEDIEGG